MYKAFSLFIIVFFASFSHAYISAIAIEQSSGKVLLSEMADDIIYPASLTKMMTAYIALEKIKNGSIKWGKIFVVSENAASKIPSSIGLKAGNRISLKDAMLTMLTKSANDSATVIAEGISGSERRFSKEMTKKAKSFGMRNTRFTNSSGLHSRDHISTARDMSILARRLLNDFPEYEYLFRIKSVQYNGHTIYNTNRLVYSHPQTTGIKTGYTSQAGHNLAYSQKRENKKVITIVMHAPTSEARYKKSLEYMDRAFKILQRKQY